MNDYQAKLQLNERGCIGAENLIVCPYCFHNWRTEGEADEAPYSDEKFECYQCGEKFSLDCEPTGDFWFTTRPLKNPKEVLKNLKWILENQDDPHEAIMLMKKEMGVE